MTSLFQLGYFSTFAVNLALALIVLSHKKRARVGLYFGLFVFAISFWILTLYFFYLFADPDVVLLFGRLNFVFATGIVYFVVLFSQVFPEDGRPIPIKIQLVLGIPTAALALLTQFTPLVDAKEIVSGASRVTVYGPLYFLFILHFIFFAGYAIWRLVIKYLSFPAGDLRRLQIRYFGFGFALSVFFGAATNIFIPLIGGNYDFQHLGPLGTVFLVGLTTYAIVRHRLLQLKVIATELFAAALLVFLTIEAAFSSSPFELVVRVVILLFSIFLSIQLVKSVLLEVRRREEIQKLADDLKKANAKLSELSEIKSNFVSIASHQLRAPIGGVRSYLTMMRDEDFGPLPNKQKKIIELNLDVLDHTLHVIEMFLDVTKMESGKIDLSLKKTDLAEMTESVRRELALSAERKGLRLRTRISEGLPAAQVDPEKIRNVIFNLVENAIKYTERGTVEIILRKSNHALECRVADTGIGIEKEEIPKLFSKFVRAGGGFRVSHGSGLGLYIIKALVEAHGGTVFVESPGEGKGSVFGFRLPLVSKRR